MSPRVQDRGHGRGLRRSGTADATGDDSPDPNGDAAIPTAPDLKRSDDMSRPFRMAATPGDGAGVIL